MLLHEITPETTAYQLAHILERKLSLEVALSNETSSNAHFEFDPDRRIVLCSNQPISVIAKKEASDDRAVASYRAVLGMASKAIRPSDKIPECILYAVFSCLHEFGHYRQSLECDRFEFEKMANQRESMLDAAKRDAQRNADEGMSPQLVYSIFEDRYRKIPVENDADIRALTMLAQIVAP